MVLGRKTLDPENPGTLTSINRSQGHLELHHYRNSKVGHELVRFGTRGSQDHDRDKRAAGDLSRTDPARPSRARGLLSETARKDTQARSGTKQDRYRRSTRRGYDAIRCPAGDRVYPEKSAIQARHQEYACLPQQTRTDCLDDAGLRDLLLHPKPGQHHRLLDAILRSSQGRRARAVAYRNLFRRFIVPRGKADYGLDRDSGRARNQARPLVEFSGQSNIAKPGSDRSGQVRGFHSRFGTRNEACTKTPWFAAESYSCALQGFSQSHRGRSLVRTLGLRARVHSWYLCDDGRPLRLRNLGFSHPRFRPDDAGFDSSTQQRSRLRV